MKIQGRDSWGIQNDLTSFHHSIRCIVNKRDVLRTGACYGMHRRGIFRAAVVGNTGDSLPGKQSRAVWIQSVSRGSVKWGVLSRSPVSSRELDKDMDEQSGGNQDAKWNQSGASIRTNDDFNFGKIGMGEADDFLRQEIDE